MTDKEILDWLDENCKAHINTEGQFVLLAQVPGKATTFTYFDGADIRDVVEKINSISPPGV